MPQQYRVPALFTVIIRFSLAFAEPENH